MAMTLGSRGGASPDINVTPMIDVLLVLLIIFMVVFPHKSIGEQALIPQKTSDPDPKIEETVVIQLRQAPDGQRASLSINEEHSVGFHIGDEKELAVGRDPDVLRHAVRRGGLSVVLFIELHLADDFPLHQIDLDKTATGKFAREVGVPAVD